MCGSTRNVEVAHLNGHEEDGAPENLAWQCRSCNVRCANALRAAGLGRLTRQFNPAEADEWLIQRARASATGAGIHRVEQLIGGYRMYAAVLRRKPEDRETERQFRKAEAMLRAASARRANPSGGAKSLAQWLTAVRSMKGEADTMPVAAAVEMIRTTPPERRSSFAREIWELRRARYGPTGRSAGVPF